MSTRLFVSGLSQRTTERDLHEAFTPHGEVKDARIMTYRDAGRGGRGRSRDKGRGSRGIGYVTMASEPEALAAIESLNGGFIDGRTIRVELAR